MNVADSPPPSQGAAPAADRAGVTPMMAQYWDLKGRHPDALLFYRMGDFYELFFEDAVAAAAALDIALTKRGKHQGEDVAMCGVPVERAEGYLERLIAKGFRVAVAEQTEDPAEAKKRKGAKALVRREVVRLVTPGTITEETLLDARAPSRLAALGWAGGGAGLALAWADVAEGSWAAQGTDRTRLALDLARVGAKEVLVPEPLLDEEAVRTALSEGAAEAAVTPVASARFDARAAARRIAQAYVVASVEAFGDFESAEISALGALFDYVETTQAGAAPRLAPPVRLTPEETLAVDAAARINLEIARTLSGQKRGSLMEAVDLCVGAAGSRLLLERLSAPSARLETIRARHDAVAFFLEDAGLRAAVRGALGAAPDVMRPWTRLVLGRGGPRDACALARAMEAAAALTDAFGRESRLLDPPDDVARALDALRAAAEGPAGEVAARIGAECVAEPPARLSDGDFVAPGVDPALDAARDLSRDAGAAMARLAEDYAAMTGAKNLKIKRNAVIGWFIEVPASQEETLTGFYGDERFTRRQSMANAVRFSTERLAELEGESVRAAETARGLEHDRFAAWRAGAEEAGRGFRAAAQALAELDVAAAAAELSQERGWVRPEMTEEPAFRVTRGRHPVVERALKREGRAFTPNDATLEAGGEPALVLVTGPNMAGKSTYLRQNALILILAQAGLFTPADAATLGVADKLFSRVGAADDLARGRSTFMMEMLETAAILRQATPKSFVILDEVGRGTATFDGLAIAWAVMEHLHEVNRARTLFATHFHELTRREGELSRLRNISLKAREHEGDLIFLHEVADGPADRSYGVAAAKLAGLPPAVIARAGEVLARLESDQEKAAARLDALPLFAAAAGDGRATGGAGSGVRAAPAPHDEPEALKRLRALDPDAMSPRDALDALYALRGLAEDG